VIPNGLFGTQKGHIFQSHYIPWFLMTSLTGQLIVEKEFIIVECFSNEKEREVMTKSDLLSFFSSYLSYACHYSLPWGIEITTLAINKRVLPHSRITRKSSYMCDRRSLQKSIFG
jgi:hypothetical protein